jgi:hypothetical protein
MKDVLLTTDGYFFEQLPNGMYTDGDMTFDYNMSEDGMCGVVWQFFNGFYCADGDGMVTVQPVGKHFIVAEQGAVMSLHDTLREAVMAAQSILATDYTEVYESCLPFGQ